MQKTAVQRHSIFLFFKETIPYKRLDRALWAGLQRLCPKIRTKTSSRIIRLFFPASASGLPVLRRDYPHPAENSQAKLTCFRHRPEPQTCKQYCKLLQKCRSGEHGLHEAVQVLLVEAFLLELTLRYSLLRQTLSRPAGCLLRTESLHQKASSSLQKLHWS